MLKFFMLISGCGMAIGAFAAPLDNRMFSVSSVSGQFVAFERKPSLTAASFPGQKLAPGSQAFVLPLSYPTSATNPASLTLEPASLVVSCERVKGELLKDLGLVDTWESKINVVIDDRLAPDAMPRVAAIHDRHQWSYEVTVPKSLPPQSLIRALVSSMLVEIANRSGSRQTPDVPLWLIEGLSAHIQASGPPLLTPDVGTGIVGDRINIEGQKRIRWLLRDQSPLTFQQLGAADHLDSEADREFFRACSQLFVEELLNLNQGDRKLSSMLAMLGTDHHWQNAFLIAFRMDFGSALDVEKWWCVSCVDFKSAESGQYASTTEVWRRLQETLDVPVEVQLATQRAPSEARITLQDAISNWKPAESDAVVTRAIVRLELQRYRSTDSLRPIIDEYIIALNDYVREEKLLNRANPTLRNNASQLTNLHRNICGTLGRLDAKRDEIRTTMLLARNQAIAPAAPVKNVDSTPRDRISTPRASSNPAPPATAPSLPTPRASTS